MYGQLIAQTAFFNSGLLTWRYSKVLRGAQSIAGGMANDFLKIPEVNKHLS